MIHIFIHRIFFVTSVEAKAAAIGAVIRKWKGRHDIVKREDIYLSPFRNY